MEFSEIFPHTLRSCCAISPNGQFVAACDTFRAVVRDARTLETLANFNCSDKIEFMSFSPDSTMVLCAMYKRKLIEIWHMEFGDWRCKIDEGSAGVTSVMWSPDSRHILTTAEFSIRITVWSLADCTVAYIKQPKQCKNPIDFSPDGSYLAVVERNNSVGIFDCNDVWKLSSHFNTEAKDIASVKWSPDCRHLLVLDSTTNYCALVYNNNGKLLKRISIEKSILGIKSADWSPTGQFFTLGGSDGVARLVCNSAWFVLKDLFHNSDVDWRQCAVFREYFTRPTDILAGPEARSRVATGAKRLTNVKKRDEYGLPILHDDEELKQWKEQTLTTKTRYEFVESSHCDFIRLQEEALDLDRTNPALGIGTCMFSADGRYLATINDKQPTVVWIWDISKLKLFSVLIHKQPVTCIRWDPFRPRLAISTQADGRFYLWSRGGALVAAIPVNKGQPAFSCRTLQWSPDGTSILVASKDSFCICFVTDPSS